MSVDHETMVSRIEHMLEEARHVSHESKRADALLWLLDQTSPAGTKSDPANDGHRLVLDGFAKALHRARNLPTIQGNPQRVQVITLKIDALRWGLNQLTTTEATR